MRRAAQARALVDGRDYCIPDDVRELAVDVLAHRVLIDPRAPGRGHSGEETAWIVREILERVQRPALSPTTARLVRARGRSCGAGYGPRRTLRPDPARAGCFFCHHRSAVGFAALNTGQQPALPGALADARLPRALRRALSESALRGISSAPPASPRSCSRAPPPVVGLAAHATGNVGCRPSRSSIEDRLIGRRWQPRGPPGAPLRSARRARVRRRPAQLPHLATRSNAASCEFVGFNVFTRFPFGLFSKALTLSTRPSAHPGLPPASNTRRRAARTWCRDPGSRQQGRSTRSRGSGALVARTCGTWDAPGDRVAPHPLAGSSLRLRELAGPCSEQEQEDRTEVEVTAARLRARRRRRTPSNARWAGAASEVVALPGRGLSRRSVHRLGALRRRLEAPASGAPCSPSWPSVTPGAAEAA